MFAKQKRIYALASWTVKRNGEGWYVHRTGHPAGCSRAARNPGPHEFFRKVEFKVGPSP